MHRFLCTVLLFGALLAGGCGQRAVVAQDPSKTAPSSEEATGTTSSEPWIVGTWSGYVYDMEMDFYFSEGGGFDWTVDSSAGTESFLEGEWTMRDDGLVELNPLTGGEDNIMVFLRYAAFDGTKMHLAPAPEGFELTALIHPGVAQVDIDLFLDSVESNPLIDSFTYTSAAEHLRQYEQDVERYPDVPPLEGPLPGTVAIVLVDANELTECMRWLENEPRFSAVCWEDQPLRLLGAVSAERQDR